MEGNQYSHAWNRLPAEELMERLEVTVRDEETGKTVLTLAGLLMFGTDDAIRKFRPRYQVNYYGYTLHDLGDVRRRWSDRICQDGTWEANLFQFFFRVLPLISEPLRRPFQLNPDMVTAQGESTGHVAVREALANAIVHADYKGMGGIIVRKYPDRLELSNPGTLLVSRERMLKGGISECRNADMQKMLQAIGVVDKAGTGIDKIMQGWKDQCLDSPTVEEEHDPERIVWTLPYVSLLPKVYESQLSQRFGAERYDRLDAEDRHILLMLASEGSMTHRELHSSIGAMHPAELSKRLSRLVQRDFLSRSGRASATRYQLTGENDGVGKGAYSEHSTPNTAQSPGSNKHCSEFAGAEHAVSVYYAEAEGLPESVRNELQEFLFRSYNKKKQTEDMILAICRGRWITLPVLSQLLERHPVALRTRYLQPMIGAGKLHRKHESPNHRDQAYMTAE